LRFQNNLNLSFENKSSEGAQAHIYLTSPKSPQGWPAIPPHVLSQATDSRGTSGGWVVVRRGAHRQIGGLACILPWRTTGLEVVPLIDREAESDFIMFPYAPLLVVTDLPNS
jgi:hypothetical protein